MGAASRTQGKSVLTRRPTVIRWSEGPAHRALRCANDLDVEQISRPCRGYDVPFTSSNNAIASRIAASASPSRSARREDSGHRQVSWTRSRSVRRVSSASRTAAFASSRASDSEPFRARSFSLDGQEDQLLGRVIARSVRTRYRRPVLGIVKRSCLYKVSASFAALAASVIRFRTRSRYSH